MLALTGDLELAHAVVSMSYTRAWQAWPAVRTLDWPVMWVRSDAVRRLRRSPRAPRLLDNGADAIEPVRLASEDQELITGLRWLPAEQRLFLVLHEMSQVPVDAIAEWFGGTVQDVEDALDTGFDALVSILEQPGGGRDGNLRCDDLPDEAAAEEAQARFDELSLRTDEMLESVGYRLRTYLPTPPPTTVFRRAAVTKVTRRGAPATAAAAAACIGLTVLLSPTPPSSAEAESLASSPPPIFIEQPAAPAGKPVATLPVGTSPTAPLLRITRVAGETATSSTAQFTPPFGPVEGNPATSTPAAPLVGPTAVTTAAPAAADPVAATSTATGTTPGTTSAGTGTSPDTTSTGTGTTTATTPATTTTTAKTTTPVTTTTPTKTDPATTSDAPDSDTSEPDTTTLTTTTSQHEEPATDEPAETTTSTHSTTADPSSTTTTSDTSDADGQTDTSAPSSE
jgi:hypothetical protein